MKTITAIAAAAICGFTVLVSGCSEETPAQTADKGIKQAAADLSKAADKTLKEADALVKEGKKKVEEGKKKAAEVKQ